MIGIDDDKRGATHIASARAIDSRKSGGWEAVKPQPPIDMILRHSTAEEPRGWGRLGENILVEGELRIIDLF